MNINIEADGPLHDAVLTGNIESEQWKLNISIKIRKFQVIWKKCENLLKMVQMSMSRAHSFQKRHYILLLKRVTKVQYIKFNCITRHKMNGIFMVPFYEIVLLHSLRNSECF